MWEETEREVIDREREGENDRERESKMAVENEKNVKCSILFSKFLFSSALLCKNRPLLSVVTFICRRQNTYLHAPKNFLLFFYPGVIL